MSGKLLTVIFVFTTLIFSGCVLSKGSAIYNEEFRNLYDIQKKAEDIDSFKIAFLHSLLEDEHGIVPGKYAQIFSRLAPITQKLDSREELTDVERGYALGLKMKLLRLIIEDNVPRIIGILGTVGIL